MTSDQWEQPVTSDEWLADTGFTRWAPDAVMGYRINHMPDTHFGYPRPTDEERAVSMTTWRKELAREMREAGDAGPVVAYAPDEAAFDVEFDDGYGLVAGPRVLAWTEQYVYFPVVYDGAEWLGRAPRNPTSEGQGHVGRE